MSVTAITRKNIATHPELATYALGAVRINWSRHAIERAETKGVPYSTHLNVAQGTIVETESCPRTHKVLKLVVRVTKDSLTDAVYVIVPGVGRLNFTLVTVWVNDKRDTHKTLRKERISHAA